MKLLFIKSTWGMTESSLDEKFKRIKNSGFDGVEMGSPEEEDEQLKFRILLEKYDLRFIAQQWTSGETKEEHLRSFEEQFIRNSRFNPLLINSHSGRDYFSFEDNLEIIRSSYEIAEKFGVKLTHETHRSRFPFYPRITYDYLNAFNKLKLTADFSHWCCVSESLLEDQEIFLDKAIENSEHIHARIGYAQGPQISDPRAPEWERNIEIHFEWWEKIIKKQAEAGVEFLTITPEFGPSEYMHTIPFSRKPVSNLWDINLYMKEILTKRYNSYL